MDIGKVIDNLSTLEAERSVVTPFEYRDTNAWIHIKFHIFSAIVNQKKQAKSKNPSMIFKAFMKSLGRMLFSGKGKQTLFFGSTRGLRSFAGTVSDMYFPYDILEPQATAMCMNLNDTRDLEQYKNYLQEHRVIFDNLVIAGLAKLLKPLSGFFYSRNFEDVADQLSAYGIKVNNEKLNQYYLDFILRYRLYNLFLKRHKQVSSAYIVSAYSKSYICAALKNNNIKVAEIQHGSVGRRHIGYHYQPGYALPVPDVLYVYNDFWKREMQRCNFSQSIGLYNSSKYRHLEQEQIDVTGDYLIFTGQGIFYPEIVAFLEKGLPFLKQQGLKLIYKPHPSEAREGSAVKDFCARTLECVFYEGSSSTEKLIACSVGHISVYSSCHFDAVDTIGQTHVLRINNQPGLFADYQKNFPDKFIAVEQLHELNLAINQ